MSKDLTEALAPGNISGVTVSKGFGVNGDTEIHGKYIVECRDSKGNLKWADEVDNVVTTVGRNLLLDTGLAGSAYTVTGPYMGLINGSASSAAAGDTMASHAAWLEVGGANAPTYSGTRKTVAWSAAASGTKSTSSNVTFAITSSGTVGGCFIVYGSGALSTIDNTAGTLYSAGAFTNGSRSVVNGDQIAVSYSTSLT